MKTVYEVSELAHTCSAEAKVYLKMGSNFRLCSAWNKKRSETEIDPVQGRPTAEDGSVIEGDKTVHIDGIMMSTNVEYHSRRHKKWLAFIHSRRYTHTTHTRTRERDAE